MTGLLIVAVMVIVFLVVIIIIQHRYFKQQMKNKMDLVTNQLPNPYLRFDLPSVDPKEAIKKISFWDRLKHNFIF